MSNTTFIRENGASSGVGVLATYQYDSLSRRSSVTFGDGVVQNFTYDNASRLASLSNDLTSTANDLLATFTYNPASQITSVTRSNDLYAWTGHANQNDSSTPNGLNQIANVGAKTVTHDNRGNITGVGSDSYAYSSENFLTSGPGSTTLGYDPMGRLYQVAQGANTTRIGYDGLDRIAEYDASNAVQRRYIHGPGIDNPITAYEGSGTTSRSFLSSDERGSVITLTDSSGTLLNVNKYDEYGVPQPTNLGAFGYTGQIWLPSIKLWYYKARMYGSEPGRFWQTDPIGYRQTPNLYAYVLNDPINLIDPLGLEIIVVVGKKKRPPPCDGICIGGDFSDIAFAGPILGWLRDFEDIGGLERLTKEAKLQCETPPVSNTERSAALAGNRGKFWSSRTARGDPFGPIGLTTFTNSSLAGQWANYRLRQAIFSRSPSMGPEAISAEVQQIGVQIMQTYVGAVSRFGDVSAQQFADIHYTVLGAHNLPATTFGGSPLFGSGLETALSSPAWDLCDE